MRVGFDTSGLDPTFKDHASRGIGRYVTELKRGFDARGSESVAYFDYRWFRGPAMLDALVGLAPFGRQTLRQQLIYPLLIGQKTAAFDLIHFPAHMDAPSWCPKPYVLTVLDLIPLLMRDLYETPDLGWRFRLARWLECQAIRNAAHIVAISECTARDVHRVLGVPKDRISVTPLGVDHKFFEIPRSPEVKQKFQIGPEQPLMLYVGGIDQRKNIAGLISVFGAVCTARVAAQKSPPVLLMAGKMRDHKEFSRLEGLIAALPSCARVILPGYVPEPELHALYGASDLFYFPSLYEGFGLTPLEAMAAGIPVVSSNTSAMPEVLGDGAILVPPNDTAGTVAAMLTLLDDRTLAEDLSGRGIARARRFTWTRTVELTLAAYARAAKQLHLAESNVVAAEASLH